MSMLSLSISGVSVVVLCPDYCRFISDINVDAVIDFESPLIGAISFEAAAFGLGPDKGHSLKDDKANLLKRSVAVDDYFVERERAQKET
jgi:hypothetical protein